MSRNKKWGSLCIGFGAIACILALVWGNLSGDRNNEEANIEEPQMEDTNVEGESVTEEFSQTTRLYPSTFPFYGVIGFWERTDNPENTFPDDMIEALQSALKRDEILDCVADISADYVRMSEQEILQCMRDDTSGILESYYYDEMKEGAEWFLFSGDGDIMVREEMDKDGYEYVYYKFPHIGNGVYDVGLDAYGKTADYAFIQWDGEDYLLVTRLDSSGESIEGIGVYYMLGYSLIGSVLCLDKSTDDVRFLSYVINGSAIYGPPYPDY